MRIYLFIFSLLLWSTLSGAQERKISGLIMYNNNRLSDAIIKNLNTHTQISSDDRGEFIISAKPGDTLIAIKDDYFKDTLLVADQQGLIIQLHKNPLILKEVVINSTSISPASIYEANKKEYKEIYFLGDNKGIFLTDALVNIDKLNNALGKKGHQARRLEHKLTTDYKNSVVDKRFNPIAARITGYKGKRLSDFIMDNRPPYETVVNATGYDLTQYVKKRVTEEKNKHN
jgi:hypothetical protein